ncbi:DUF6541 family protein [Actinokineospora sp. 24-640]
MSWWQLAPALLVTAAIVFLPGYLVLRCWAVTGLVAVGMAAPLSVSLIAVTAILGPWAGLGWSVLLVVVPAVVLAAAGLAVRALRPAALGVHGRPHRPTRSRWTLLAHFGALLIPAVLLTRGLTRMIGGPENISQTYDNIFHLNAIRYILETGSGSTLTMGGMASAGARPSVYPAAWHDVVSLVAQVSGGSIAEAVNAVTLVVGALVWPISVIFLTTRVTGTRPVPVLFAGALSAVFGAFPYLMVDFGVLYPYFLSLALLPAALALVVMATGVGERGGVPRWLAGVGVVAASPGVALAHPSTVLVLLVFAVPVFVVGIVRYRRVLLAHRAAATRYWVLLALLGGYLAVGVVLWTRLRPTDEASLWKPFQTIPQAIGQVMSGGYMDQGPAWVVLLLTVVALGLVTRRQFSQWVVGVYLIAAGLFIVVSAVPPGALRDFLTGVWYNDNNRLAAIMPMITVVVCAIAASWWFDRGKEMLARRYPRLAPRTEQKAALAAFVLAALMGVVGQYSSVNYAVADGMADYRAREGAPVLSPAEEALLERLDEHVPPDARIIANPWTGTSLAYAIGERRTLTPHVGGRIPDDVAYVMNNLDRMDSDPRVCATIRELNSFYVLDFEGRQVHNRDIRFGGLELPFINPGLTRIDGEGAQATLFRVTGC